MVLPHIHKKIRFVNIALVALFLVLSCQTAYSQEDRLGLDAIKSERCFVPGSNVSHSSKLAPTSMFEPIYKVQKGEDGKLSVIEPRPDQKESLYTEVVLALIAHSVDNGISEGPFEEFIERSIGGNDFQKCRIGSVKRVGNVFYALYLSRVDPHDPDVMFLRFSAVPKDRIIDGSKAAVMRLPDGTGILIEAFPFAAMPKEYDLNDKERIETVHEVAELVLAGMPGDAVERLFTGGCFQDRRSDVLADICNRLIGKYAEDESSRGAIKAFLTRVMHISAELLDDGGFSRSVQLIAGQALTINSWNDAKIPGSGGLRVTADAENMISNEKHGESYVDNRGLPKDVVETKKEGSPGFFWRGAERIAKLGPNVAERYIHDKARFKASGDRMVMYLMDHGFCQVPEQLAEPTRERVVSTIHETFFLNDLLPGSFQTTSTGAGHFQGTKLDVKLATAGWGIQFNVKYDGSGRISEVVAQEIKAGDMTLALPGYVDYMVNLGGLRFNDFSIDLRERAHYFNADFDFSEENLGKVEKAFAEKGKKAPYLAAKAGERAYLVLNDEGAPAIKWMINLPKFSSAITLENIYRETKVDELVSILKDGLEIGRVGEGRYPSIDVLRDGDIPDPERIAAPSLGKVDGIIDYLSAGLKVERAVDGVEEAGTVLVRIPVEVLEAAGPENVKQFLSEFSALPRVYVELFSSSSIGPVAESVYSLYHVANKRLPADFVPSRENTVTVMPMMKSEVLTAKGKPGGDWGIGDIRPTETILSPVGLSNDKAGLIRGVIFGLRLNEIARQVNKDGRPEEAFLKETYEQYRSFCVSQGVKDFSVNESDLFDLAAGNINKIVEALNRLIKSLPIVPLNAEELRVIYEHAREALIRA